VLHYVLDEPKKPMEELMAFNTVSGPFLLNLNSLQNVVTSASGNAGANMTTSVNNILTILNTTNASLSINSLSVYSGSNITCKNNLNLTNSALYINSNPAITSNSINGTPYLAIQTAGVEKARFTGTGLGVMTSEPLQTLDVNGSALIRGDLYVSSMGNVYIDSDLFVNGTHYPSDPKLKENVRPYTMQGLPTPVRFTWKATGMEDIGVLADEVMNIEPSCVRRNHDGSLGVDYAKLSVLCFAECIRLREELAELKRVYAIKPQE